MTSQSIEPSLTVLLGLPFHDLTLSETLDYCSHAMAGEVPRYLVTANVDFTTQAYEDVDLKKIVFFADRVVCDGMPLVWLSRLLGHPLRERVAGSDMVPMLLEICGRLGHSVYFLGSDLETLKEAKEIAEQRYPGLKVAGMDSPPMGAVVEWDNEGLCERMRASGAKLLLACLGCPKQERWIFAHHQDTGIPLSIGVGASLDFITGKQKRAPKWMQKSGLEWFWRMSSSPKRLVSRYRKDLGFLITASIRQGLSQWRRSSLADSVVEIPTAVSDGGSACRIAWAGELRQGDWAGAPVPDSIDAPVLLDASRVTFMDSSGLGRLAGLVRGCRSAVQPLLVVNPSPAFTKAVQAAQMVTLFTTVESEAKALEMLPERGEQDVIHAAGDDGVLWVPFKGPLDAVYHEEMVSILEVAMSNQQDAMSLVVDLRSVTFIDSRAVGGLIRAWKMMRSRGGDLFLAGANSTVSEIISLLRLDQVLKRWEGELQG